jgi:hypothetical protein
MGEGWVVMLDTLRRVEALLDRVSFLGPKRPAESDIRSDEKDAYVNEIQNSMNKFLGNGFTFIGVDTELNRVNYRYHIPNRSTFILYVYHRTFYKCDIYRGSTLVNSLGSNSLDELTADIGRFIAENHRDLSGPNQTQGSSANTQSSGRR